MPPITALLSAFAPAAPVQLARAGTRPARCVTRGRPRDLTRARRAAGVVMGQSAVADGSSSSGPANASMARTLICVSLTAGSVQGQMVEVRRDYRPQAPLSGEVYF